MARNLQTLCDACNAVLYGHDRAAFIQKPFVEIKGTILLQNEEVGIEKKHIYVTRNEERDLFFCNWACVADFANSRKEQYLMRFREDLRKEADNEPWNKTP